MNTSKHEQRVLHALAQGGMIVHRRDPETGKTVEVDCSTSRRGLAAVRAQLDNR